MIQKNNQKTWLDHRGNDVPRKYVPKFDRYNETQVSKIFNAAVKLNEQMIRFKEMAYSTADALYAEMLREANIEPSSRKGNYTLTSFDKSIRIEVNINELIEFDENINLAHMKLHEFIEMKTNGADSDIIALINQAFTTRKGRLDKARIFGLFSLNITHPLWQEAMELIRKSINRNSTVRYMEIAEKDENGRYVPIRLNFATI